MNLRVTILLVASLLITSAVRAQDPKQLTVAETVDDLVAKNIEAKGGAAAIQSVSLIRFQQSQTAD